MKNSKKNVGGSHIRLKVLRVILEEVTYDLEFWAMFSMFLQVSSQPSLYYRSPQAPLGQAAPRLRRTRDKLEIRTSRKGEEQTHSRRPGSWPWQACRLCRTEPVARMRCRSSCRLSRTRDCWLLRMRSLAGRRTWRGRLPTHKLRSWRRLGSHRSLGMKGMVNGWPTASQSQDTKTYDKNNIDECVTFSNGMRGVANTWPKRPHSQDTGHWNAWPPKSHTLSAVAWHLSEDFFLIGFLCVAALSFSALGLLSDLFNLLVC